MNKEKIYPKILAYTILIINTVLALMPFYIMIIMGTYKNEEIFTGVKLLPGSYILGNFKTITQSNMLRPYVNSVFISLVSVVACVLISSMAGYGLAKFRFKGRWFMKSTLLITLMLPYQISLAGYMMEMRWAGINNTLWPMILLFFANPFGAYWMMQYISSAIPNSIIESARIDGCNELRLYARIILPIVKPAIITLALLVFLWSWNNFLIAVIFVSNPIKYTIPIFISTLGGSYRVDYAAKFLTLTISTIPVLVFFSIFSKYLIKGMTIGAVKE